MCYAELCEIFKSRLKNHKIKDVCTLYPKSHQYLQLHHLKVFKMQLATLPFTRTAVTYDSHMMVVDVISKQCSDQQALLPDATISSTL